MGDFPFIQFFKTSNNYYIFDVNTNKIIKIEAEVYELLNKGFDLAKEHPTVKNLIKQGFLSCNRPLIIYHPYNDVIEHFLDSKIDKITLQVTQECNYRCNYCVYSDRPSNKNRHHAKKIMNIELAKKCIDFYLQHSEDSLERNIGFYGGEPLLQFELIKECVKYAIKKMEGKIINFNITTNGSLFSDDIIDFLVEHNFNLLISLDGPKDIHDKNRIFAFNNNSTYESIMDNLTKIRDKYPDYYKQIGFSVVIDPTNNFECTNNFFMTEDIVNEIRLTTAIANSSYGNTNIAIDYNFKKKWEYEKFKFLLSKIGKLDKKYISKITEGRFTTYKKILKQLILPTKKLPQKTSHSGPCLPGQLRLFIDVNGNFFPCERIIEKDGITNIGNIEKGFDLQKVSRLLNIENVTEGICNNCFAIRNCSLCASLLINDNDISIERSIDVCKSIRNSFLESLTDICMLFEFGYKYSDDILN